MFPTDRKIPHSLLIAPAQFALLGQKVYHTLSAELAVHSAENGSKRIPDTCNFRPSGNKSSPACPRA